MLKKKGIFYFLFAEKVNHFSFSLYLSACSRPTFSTVCALRKNPKGVVLVTATGATAVFGRLLRREEFVDGESYTVEKVAGVALCSSGAFTGGNTEIHSINKKLRITLKPYYGEKTVRNVNLTHIIIDNKVIIEAVTDTRRENATGCGCSCGRTIVVAVTVAAATFTAGILFNKLGTQGNRVNRLNHNGWHTCILPF